MRIAIAGTGRLAASLLVPLLDSSHEVVAVLQNGRKVKGFKRWWGPLQMSILGGMSSMAGMAHRRGIPIVWLEGMGEELEALRALEPEIILVGGFDIIFKRPILDLPSIGCVNTHSSLLPKHRGPNPFCWVLLAGDDESGVTFHVMEEGIDTGAILDQTPFPIEATDTSVSLYMKSCEVAGDRVVEVMDRVAMEGLQGSPQDPDAATYDPKVTAQDALIDWTMPAETIQRRIRALFPLHMGRFMFRGRPVRVSRAAFDPTPVEAEPGTVLYNRLPVRIATGQGTLIIRTAFCSYPVPGVWPAPWCRPNVGEKME